MKDSINYMKKIIIKIYLSVLMNLTNTGIYITRGRPKIKMNRSMKQDIIDCMKHRLTKKARSTLSLEMNQASQ